MLLYPREAQMQSVYVSVCPVVFGAVTGSGVEQRGQRAESHSIGGPVSLKAFPG